MSSNKKTDPMAAHLNLGASNEELQAKQREYERKVASGEIADVKFTRDNSKPQTGPFRNENFDNQLEGWGDLEFDPLGSRDPLQSAVDSHRIPGMAYKLISERVAQHTGTHGYKPVKDAHGDVVKVGNMYLGMIPEAVAEKRRQHYVDESKLQLKSIKDRQREDVDKLKHSAKEMGLQVLEPGERVESGDGRARDAGIHVERGEDLAA